MSEDQRGREGGRETAPAQNSGTHLILDPEPALLAEVARPLLVDLALKIEGILLVRHVTRRDDKGEADPKEERVHGEERPVVKNDAGVADDGAEDAERGGNRRDWPWRRGRSAESIVRDPLALFREVARIRTDEDVMVSGADDVGAGPDVEPNKEEADEAGESIQHQLTRERADMSVQEVRVWERGA